MQISLVHIVGDTLLPLMHWYMIVCTRRLVGHLRVCQVTWEVWQLWRSGLVQCVNFDLLDGMQENYENYAHTNDASDDLVSAFHL